MNKKRKKDLIIIIPGVKTLGSLNPGFREFILNFTKVTRLFRPVYYDYTRDWVKKLRKKGKKVIILHWGRNMTYFSKFSAQNKLKNLIKKYKYRYNIKIIGISMGGKIAFDTTKHLNEEDIKKLILVCSVGIPDKAEVNFPLVNLYSNSDELARIASELISPLDKSLEIIGRNIKNILLSLDHYDFCVNNKIPIGKFKGKTVIEVIESHLK